MKSAFILLAMLSLSAWCGPLLEPAQCAVFWRNIEKVESWTAERKNQLYWQCLSRTMEWRRATKLTLEESIKLREAWLLTPAPERDE